MDDRFGYRLTMANDWLVVFVVVVAVDGAVLLVDLYLRQMGWTTITDYSRAFWPLGAALVAWQLLGALALALHFWV